MPLDTGTGRPAPAAHHGLAAHEVVLLLETDPRRGLSREEAALRRERYGPNVLPAAARGGWLRLVLRQFQHPLVHILIAAGAITAALGEYVDSAVIFGVVLVNALVGCLQEAKAEAALDSLRALVHTTARVVRGGREATVPSEELVPGDLVRVEAGDKVPADLRLLRSTGLHVDESALTGESVPVAKDDAVLAPGTPVADRLNMVHSGTLVTAGDGSGIVVATGPETELGEIHRLVGAAATLATPLTLKLAAFSRVLTVVIIGLAALTFAVGVARDQGVVDTFTAAVALAVGAIPEGLPAAVTITLAIGVGRMAKRRALIRRLPAVETLGSTTDICSDKTGTLTENQMTVRKIWTPDALYEVTGSGYAPDGAVRGGPADSVALHWTLLAGACCNDAALRHEGDRWSVLGDPTEGALLVAARKAGLPDSVRDDHPRLAAIPFSSDRRYMATLHHDPVTGGQLVLAKGAVEELSALCAGRLGADGTVRPLDRDALLAAADALAAEGLRVLATAVRLPDPAGAVAPDAPATGPDPRSAVPFDDDRLTGRLVLTGLQAMLDPPRAAAAAAVRACHSAGITVRMITGDHAATARSIAGGLDLLPAGAAEDGRVLTGRDLAALPADAYPDAVDRARVYARVSPEQKLRLVEALQDRGRVVAMTGDGVNDAPALRQADIGVAMGLGGTEVAKDAADMVLTDDDFATIESAVEEGRGVFDNLTKFVVWTLPTNMGEGLVILVAILLGATLPILPTQILWINMTTAVALGLMLAFEPKEPGIMTRAPRDPARPLLTGTLIVRVLLVSALLVAGSWWVFSWEQGMGSGLAESRTAAVNLFVAVELVYLFSCRSLTRPVWRIGWFSNPWVVGGVLTQVAGQLALTYLPVMNRLFHTAPLGADSWLRIAGVAVLTSAAVAAHKYLQRQPM
ncbi:MULTISPECIES: HAD-IC family P-type ATPase [unclassified Streptomyces]|uniref:HAD-IC family P-type ATPase n=1 Tax=unclassified Streptomyces TaxID=2593676 RepID=UPI000A7017C6|nr:MULTISPECIES: HAD-IC family P-type ATPase [unclassified Streptomyces]